MSKKHYTPKRNGGSGVRIKAIIAIILAIVLAAGVCCLGFASRDDNGKWFGNFANMSEWHWTDKTQPPADNPNDNMQVTTPSGESGIAIKATKLARSEYAANGISPQAETAYWLKATLTPAEPTNPEILWTMTWADTTNEWAANKAVADYITMAIDADTHGVRVSCMAAFAERIIITATSRSNPTLKANCYLDYVRKLTAIENLAVEGGFCFSGGALSLNCRPVSTVGTIGPDFRFQVEDIRMSDGFVEQVYCPKLTEYDGVEEWDIDKLYAEFTLGNGYIPFTSEGELISFAGKTFSEVALGYNSAFFDNCLAYCLQDGNTDIFEITITITATHNGEVYSKLTKTFYPEILVGGFEIVATGLGLSDTNIKF